MVFLAKFLYVTAILFHGRIAISHLLRIGTPRSQHVRECELASLGWALAVLGFCTNRAIYFLGNEIDFPDPHTAAVSVSLLPLMMASCVLKGVSMSREYGEPIRLAIVEYACIVVFSVSLTPMLVELYGF